MRRLASASGRLAALLALLLVAIQPPVARSNERPRVREYIDGVPDTGQFLPDTTVLARVSDRRITILDFRREFFSSDPQYRPAHDSAGRAEFLSNMVRKELLGLAALSANIPLDFEDRAQLRRHEATLMSNRMFERLVLDVPPFPEDTLRKIFGYLKYDVRARWLSFPTRAEAEAASRDLRGGKVQWGTVAARYHQTHVDPDGRWWKFQDVPIEVAQQVWPLKPGAVSPIVTGVLGYQIVQVLERRPRPMPEYSIMRPTIDSGLRNYARGVRRLALTREAKGNRVFHYDSTNIAYAARLYFVAVQQDSAAGGLLIDERTPEISPEDTARTLVTWDGGRLSLGGLNAAYTSVSPVLRPVINTPDRLQDYADDVILGPDMERMAREKGMAKDPKVLRLLEDKREELMVMKMVQDSCFAGITVSAQERRAFYDQHKVDFVTYAKEVVAMVVRDTRAGADSVQARLDAGTPIRDILLADSLAGNTLSGTMDFDSESHHPLKKMLFEEMRPGDHRVVGPDKGGKWACVYVISFDPGRLLPFEQMQEPISESVRNEKSEAALKAFTARLEKRYPVEVHWDRLMLVKLTTPGVDE